MQLGPPTGRSTPQMRYQALSSLIACLRREAWVCTVPRHERDVFQSKSQIRDMLELYFFCRSDCIVYTCTQVFTVILKGLPGRF